MASSRSRNLIVLVFVLTLGMTGHARAEVSRCASIDDPRLMMKCYAELNAEMLERKAARRTKSGPFVLIATDERASWQLRADSLTRDGWGRLSLRLYASRFWVRAVDKQDAVRYEDLRPSLLLRCAGGAMSGYMVWGVFLGVEQAKITFRYDDEPAQAILAPVSLNQERIQPLTESRLIHRITEMFTKNNLTASVTPMGGDPIAVAFNLRNLEIAIAPLRESCDW